MNFKKSALLSIIALSLTSGVVQAASTSKSSNKPKDSVEFFVDNPKLTRETIKACDSNVATLSDHEKVYGPKGKCRNAMLAQKKITKMRNDPNNKKPTFKVIFPANNK